MYRTTKRKLVKSAKISSGILAAVLLTGAGVASVVPRHAAVSSATPSKSVTTSTVSSGLASQPTSSTVRFSDDGAKTPNSTTVVTEGESSDDTGY